MYSTHWFDGGRRFFFFLVFFVFLFFSLLSSFLLGPRGAGVTRYESALLEINSRSTYITRYIYLDRARVVEFLGLELVQWPKSEYEDVSNAQTRARWASLVIITLHRMGQTVK